MLENHNNTHSIEKAAKKSWRTNRWRPARRKTVLAGARFLDAIPAWLHRFRYPVAALGLAGGAASYYFVERSPALASGIAFAALCGWLLLIIQAYFSASASVSRWNKASTGLQQVVMQTIHQEALFFVLTFTLLSTDWGTIQAVFAALILLLTAIASIDPLYHLTLAPSRLALLSFHALTMFLCGFMALPIALQIPLDEALLASLLFSAVATAPLMITALKGSLGQRVGLTTACLGILCGSLWLGRAAIPPMTTKMEPAQISLGIDTEAKAPKHVLESITPDALTDNGLYAYTPIRAPLGLGQGIEHVWLHEGEEIDRIPMEITGGRAEGFRAWSHKVNFPANPVGQWQVQVRTPNGLLLGKTEFEVVAASHHP